jgi:hypothetical protein
MVQYKWGTNQASFNAIKNTLKQQSMLINSKKCGGAIISVVHHLPPLRYMHSSNHCKTMQASALDRAAVRHSFAHHLRQRFSVFR